MKHRCLSVFILTLALALPALGQDAKKSNAFEFKQDDVVAIYGNGLADRMQHEPWVESILQARLAGKNVSFRNMSFAGDLFSKRPRSKGFTNDKDYLNLVAPDVVFAFYGYNESYGGPGHVD